jgi:hypothetical protein
MEISGHAEPLCHLSPTHLWKAIEGLTQVGTVTKTVTEEWAGNEETQKLLEDVVSRLGLEPRTLALKGQPNLNKINRLMM